MTEKLMIGEIQLCYFTFCEATRKKNWVKVQSLLIQNFKDLFPNSVYKNNQDWWNVRSVAYDFDATIVCNNTIHTIDQLAHRWKVRKYQPYSKRYYFEGIVPFIKHYCNPEGSYILERVALEMII